jgi:F-type H+-transporting ATPase subunit delta
MKSKVKARRAARALYRLCLVNGALDPDRVRLVAARLAASRRRGAFAVFSQFQRLVRLDVKRHTAVIETAAPLSEAVRTSTANNLVRRYGSGLQTIFKENPALIGGMRVLVASDVYDGSVRARLAALEARL